MRSQRALNPGNHCARYYRTREPHQVGSLVLVFMDNKPLGSRFSPWTRHLCLALSAHPCIGVSHQHVHQDKAWDILPLSQSTGKWRLLVRSWATRTCCRMRTSALSVDLASWTAKESTNAGWWTVSTNAHLSSRSPFWASSLTTQCVHLLALLSPLLMFHVSTSSH